MEDWQREHIRINLEFLVDCTVLNSVLLMNLQATCILTRADTWELDAIPNQGTKVLKFYTIIQEKGNNAYQNLIVALERCGQTGASQCLAKADPSQYSSMKKSESGVPIHSAETELAIDQPVKRELGMKKWQRDHITKNLDELISCTNVNQFLITQLMSKCVITQADIWELETARKNGMQAESLKLYTIMQTKGDNAFQNLIEALEQCMQGGAVRILKDAKPTTSNASLEATLGNSETNGTDHGMEPWQRDFIKANMETLQYVTHIDARLLARLVASGHLNRQDMWALEAELNKGKQILQFYEIIQTKGNNAFEKLIHALEGCHQTGGSVLLKQAKNPNL